MLTEDGIPPNRSRLPGVLERAFRRIQRRIAVRGQVSVQRDLRLGNGSLISSPHGLAVGKSVAVGPGSIIEVDGRIGDYCLIGRNVQILGRMDHAVSEIGMPMALSTWVGDRPQVPEDSVAIGRDVWIGAGAIVLGGISIGEGAVIGAGAVVTRDIEPFGIAVGNPARVVKLRFRSDSERERHSAELDRREQN